MTATFAPMAATWVRVRILVVADRDVGPEVEQELRHLEVPCLGPRYEAASSHRLPSPRGATGRRRRAAARPEYSPRTASWISPRRHWRRGKKNREERYEPHRTHAHLPVHRKRPEIFCKALSVGGIGAVPFGPGSVRGGIKPALLRALRRAVPPKSPTCLFIQRRGEKCRGRADSGDDVPTISRSLAPSSAAVPSAVITPTLQPTYRLPDSRAIRAA